MASASFDEHLRELNEMDEAGDFEEEFPIEFPETPDAISSQLASATSIDAEHAGKLGSSVLGDRLKNRCAKHAKLLKRVRLFFPDFEQSHAAHIFYFHHACM